MELDKARVLEDEGYPCVKDAYDYYYNDDWDCDDD